MQILLLASSDSKTSFYFALFMLACCILFLVAFFALRHRRWRHVMAFAHRQDFVVHEFDLEPRAFFRPPEFDEFFDRADAPHGCRYLLSKLIDGLEVFITDVKTDDGSYEEHHYTIFLIKLPGVDVSSFTLTPQGKLRGMLRGTKGVVFENDYTFSHHSHLVCLDDDALRVFSPELMAHFRCEHDYMFEGRGRYICLSKYRLLPVSEYDEMLDLALRLAKTIVAQES